MPQKPILTVTLNPALDFAAHADRVVAGPKLRLDHARADPGGGGINVSRAIRIAGGTSRAFAALGGAMGARLVAMLAEEGIETVQFPAPGETRFSLSVTENASGEQFRFVLPGEAWRSDHVDAALDAIAAATEPGALVVLSGSQPPGVAKDFPQRLSSRLGAEVPLVVDTSGAALAHLLERPGANSVLRLDQAEAETVAMGPLDTEAKAADLADRLVARGVARVVLIARGGDGNVLSDGTRRLACRPPPVAVDSKVGAGDSFTGGFTLELARGADLAEALRTGTAAAAAAVMTGGTELCRREDLERLRPECSVTPC